MNEDNKSGSPKVNTSDAENIEEILERNGKKIAEERERKKTNMINNSLIAIPICVLLLFIIDSINFNPNIFFFLPYLIGAVMVFHIFRIIFLFPDTGSSGPWFI